MVVGGENGGKTHDRYEWLLEPERIWQTCRGTATRSSNRSQLTNLLITPQGFVRRCYS